MIFTSTLCFFCNCVTATWRQVYKRYTIKRDIELESCSHCYFNEITITALEGLFDSHYSRFQTGLFCSFVIKTIVVFKTSTKGNTKHTYILFVMAMYAFLRGSTSNGKAKTLATNLRSLGNLCQLGKALAFDWALQMIRYNKKHARKITTEFLLLKSHPKKRYEKLKVLMILTDNFASFLRFRTKVFVFEATKYERDDIWPTCSKVQSKLLLNEAT